MVERTELFETTNVTVAQTSQVSKTIHAARGKPKSRYYLSTGKHKKRIYRDCYTRGKIRAGTRVRERKKNRREKKGFLYKTFIEARKGGYASPEEVVVENGGALRA